MSDNSATIYDADYYLRGQESGKSLYRDYRWMPELTLPMVTALAEHLGLRRGDSVLDFGCARGYLVKALRACGFDARGVDHSQWAIENADPEVRGHVLCWPTSTRADWIIAKDVLEHIPDGPLQSVLSSFTVDAGRGFFIAVPLAGENGQYVVSEYELDVTHVHRLSLSEWGEMVTDIAGEAFAVSWGYRLPGLKDNYAHHRRGNGFITARRITL